MRNIKISYQYDGSSFFGFQRQPKQRTVQGEMERSLQIILKEKIDLISSGRTDRGVHALEQVSNFQTESKIPLEKLQYALSRALPEDIVLLSLEEVGESFHARFSAKTRTYCYRMCWEKNPFQWRYCSYLPKKVEEERFQSILKVFQGKHNFQNFRLQDAAYANPVREIYRIECKGIENGLEVYIQANAFLKSQIRIMLGTALEVYFGRMEEETIRQMLENQEETFPKILAPAAGLYLFKIEYEEEKR